MRAISGVSMYASVARSERPLSLLTNSAFCIESHCSGSQLLTGQLMQAPRFSIPAPMIAAQAAVISSKVCGGLAGSSPAASNMVGLMNITGFDAFQGRPQISASRL